MKNILRNLLSRLLLIVLAVVLFIPFLILVALPRKWRYDSKIVYFFVNIFYWTIIKCSLLPVSYEGLENIPHRPVIFAGNHQSSLDIPLMGVLARSASHIWLARSELMDSWLMRILIPPFAIITDVNTPLKAARSLIEVMRYIEGENGQQRHLMIFPEGSRYTDGKVHDFFSGFVILAKKTGLPVVPVRIFGVHEVYPPHTFWINYYPIRVVVGTPIEYLESDTDESFKARVYDWFIQQEE